MVIRNGALAMSIPLTSICIERVRRDDLMSLYSLYISSTILKVENISTHFSLFLALYSYNDLIFHHHTPYAQDHRTHLLGFGFIFVIILYISGSGNIIDDERVPRTRYRTDRANSRCVLCVRYHFDTWSSDRWSTICPDLSQKYSNWRVAI